MTYQPKTYTLPIKCSTMHKMKENFIIGIFVFWMVSATIIYGIQLLIGHSITHNLFETLPTVSLIIEMILFMYVLIGTSLAATAGIVLFVYGTLYCYNTIKKYVPKFKCIPDN